MQVVLYVIQRVDPHVESGRDAGGERGAEILLDVDLLVEIRLQQADVAAHHERQQRGVRSQDDLEGRVAFPSAVTGAVGQYQAEWHTGALAE